MRLSFSALSVLNFLVERTDQEQSVPEDVCPQEDLSAVHHELAEHGLVIKDDRLSGDPDFALSPQKRPQARTLAKKYRQAAIQLEILERIAENPDDGSTEDYFPPIKVRGEEVMTGEYHRAVVQLKDLGLIKGISMGNSSEMIRPELTSKGYDAFESGHAPQDWVQGDKSPSVSHTNTSYIMNNSGPVGAAQQGGHNTANVTQNVGIDAESFAAALQGIRELLQDADLEAQDRADAESQLEIIEQQVQAGAPKERIHGFFRLFSKALPAALAGEMANLIGQALTALPPV